jgi:RNA polymerase sigma-70 factor (ECF subfamily)
MAATCQNMAAGKFPRGWPVKNGTFQTSGLNMVGSQKYRLKMLRPEEQSDAELLRHMREGDEGAFRAIYHRCHGAIYRYALHMTANPSIAEDVTQETFVILIQDADRFDPARGLLAGYLFGIGRNLLSRRLEKERAFVAFPENESSSGSGHKKNGSLDRLVTLPTDLVRSEAIGRVRQAVLSLPANYREIVVLCDLQELSYEEAAGVLECAVGTVRSRLHRARALLAEKLREFRTEPQQKAAAGGPSKV